MFLFDVFSFNAPNDLAVGVARRLAFTVRAMSNDNLHSDLDVFIAMTWVDSLTGTDLRWSFVIKVLIRESKRLHALGDHQSGLYVD